MALSRNTIAEYIFQNIIKKHFFLYKIGQILKMRYQRKICNWKRYFTKNIFRPKPEGEIVLGITARSILEFFGIPWNYLELFLEFHKNLRKIPLEFLELLWNSWNSNGITGILLGLRHDEKIQLFPPRLNPVPWTGEEATIENKRQ
jgi:hypothetical protein